MGSGNDARDSGKGKFFGHVPEAGKRRQSTRAARSVYFSMKKTVLPTRVNYGTRCAIRTPTTPQALRSNVGSNGVRPRLEKSIRIV